MRIVLVLKFPSLGNISWCVLHAWFVFSVVDFTKNCPFLLTKGIRAFNFMCNALFLAEAWMSYVFLPVSVVRQDQSLV